MSCKLTDHDSEHGEDASFIPHTVLDDRYDSATKSPAWNIISALLKSSVIFMLGAIFAVILVTSRDRSGRRGTYETGFAEEKLRKIIKLHPVKSKKLIPRTQFLPQHFN
jgi:hypothetical protein